MEAICLEESQNTRTFATSRFGQCDAPWEQPLDAPPPIKNKEAERIAVMEAIVTEAVHAMAREVAAKALRESAFALQRLAWPAELTTPNLWTEKQHAPAALHFVFVNARASNGPAALSPRVQLPTAINFFVRVKFQRVGFPFPPGVSKHYLHTARMQAGHVSAGLVARIAFDARHVIGLLKHQHLTLCQLVLEVPSTESVNPGLQPTKLSFHPCHACQLHMGGARLQPREPDPTCEHSHAVNILAGPTSPTPGAAAAASPKDSTRGNAVTGNAVTGSAVAGSAVAGSAPRLIVPSAVTGNTVTGSAVSGSAPRLIVPVWPVVGARAGRADPLLIVPPRQDSIFGTFGSSDGRFGAALASFRVDMIAPSAAIKEASREAASARSKSRAILVSACGAKSARLASTARPTGKRGPRAGAVTSMGAVTGAGVVPGAGAGTSTDQTAKASTFRSASLGTLVQPATPDRTPHPSARLLGKELQVGATIGATRRSGSATTGSGQAQEASPKAPPSIPPSPLFDRTAPTTAPKVPSALSARLRPDAHDGR